MDAKALSSALLQVIAVTAALLIGLTIPAASARSVSGASKCPLSPLDKSSLYPSTTTLALHPMNDTPYQDDVVTTPTPCPATVGAGASPPVYASDPLSRKSTCPYEFFTNYDRQRIPAVYEEARCLCSGCLDAYTGVQYPDLTCQPIRYPMTVLRKKLVSPVNGFEMYSQTTEMITVGCTCARLVSS